MDLLVAVLVHKFWQAMAYLAEDHSQQHDVDVIGVARNPVPTIEGRIVEGERYDGMLLVAGHRLEETSVGRQARPPPGLEGDLRPDLCYGVLRNVPQRFELRVIEVPDLRNGIPFPGFIEVSLHRAELLHIEALATHPVS